MADCQNVSAVRLTSVSGSNQIETRTLGLLLVINAAMFVVELAAGWVAQSAGLIADSLDMLADAGVYTVALLAVGSTTRRKTHAAAVSGVIQLALAVLLAFEIARRAVSGSEPMSLLMILISALALVANAACVVLLRKHRHGEIHMRGALIFSTTDVQVNVGVMVAGLLVMITGVGWPDLVIGAGVCALVVRGGVRILKQAKASYAEDRG